jgi:acetylglutamate kinase
LKKGVLKNIKDENSLIENISAKTYAELKSSGNISKGMIPKLDNAFHAINKGVKSVKIGYSGSLKQIIEGKENVATEIVA